MSIVNRTLSLLIYLFFLLLTIFLLNKDKKNRNTKKILFFYTIILSVMAYFYTPSPGADLTRVFEMLDKYYSRLNFNDFILWSKGSTTFFSMLYYYIFAKIGNVHLLPACTALVFYTLIFKIFLNFAEKCDSKNKVLLFLFLMSNGFYVEVISGIRFMLSMSIIIWCIYLEFFKDKKIISHLPLYLIASLMHPAILIVVLIRFFYLFFQSDVNKNRKILRYMLILLFIPIFMILGKTYIMSALEKADLYLSNDIYSYFWEYIIAIIDIIYIFMILRTYRRNTKVISPIDKNYYNFVLMFFLITFLFIGTYSIFHRFRFFVHLLVIPYFIANLEALDNSGNTLKIKNYKINNIIIITIIYILTFIRGNLCGLNMFGWK